MWLHVFPNQYVKDNKIFTDIWMVITHFEDVDFPDGFTLGLVCVEVFTLLATDVDDLDSIFLSSLFTDTSSNNTTDTSEDKK